MSVVLSIAYFHPQPLSDSKVSGEASFNCQSLSPTTSFAWNLYHEHLSAATPRPSFHFTSSFSILSAQRRTCPLTTSCCYCQKQPLFSRQAKTAATSTADLRFLHAAELMT